MEQTTFETNDAAKDGQTKCPKCGATDISLNAATGELRCNFCRTTFKAESLDDMAAGVGDLQGEQVSTGAADISNAEEDQTMTLKCSSCGAEVVINLAESTQARCHWCRNTLSVNAKVPNGAVPDVVLPFKMKKQEAEGLISKYVGDRQFFANKTFKSEFTTDNIMGVYFPYMLVDMKGHATFSGEGEIKTGSYTRKISDDNSETVYKVDSYSIQRECDVEIDDLTVESSARREGASTKGETNNIINAILPFDTENSVKYDSNYLKGFTSEKRDVNKSDLQPVVDSQEKEAIKFALNDSVKQYDRGVRWDNVNVDKQGEKWLAAYLPVWLYSYVQNPGQSNQLIHYVAVNARTSETVGSVPLNLGRMWTVILTVGIILEALASGIVFGVMKTWDIEIWVKIVIIALPIIVAAIVGFSIYNKYRNTSARHHFESETKINVTNITKSDNKIRHFETTDSTMNGANNKTVYIEHIKKEAGK